ncbi:MAG: glucosidase [Gemmataceae bacterium]|jgi:hypothetical protein|nr:MAG: glucosidase [Gemmataceae bacterium]
MYTSDWLADTPEGQRVLQAAKDPSGWKLWGPYLSERQWGTVREDYSADGDCWKSFPHEHARSRAYRWGEDGLLGITDRECRLCFALVIWNGMDPILKERLFGLSNPEGNHGEDVKELYYYIDATPTANYLKALYKYPLVEFPYAELIRQNAERGFNDPEFEIMDAGVFDAGYVDLMVEYAKAEPTDLLIRVTLTNHSGQTARLFLLPTLWFRNTWSWGGGYEGHWGKPALWLEGDGVTAEHVTLGKYRFLAEQPKHWIFTENETNTARLFHSPNQSQYVKDAFHEWLINGREDAVNPAHRGTKTAAVYELDLLPGQPTAIRLRLRQVDHGGIPFGEEFDSVFRTRITEADEFFQRLAPNLSDEEKRVFRQACAGLIWSQQFYYYHVRDWVSGDPAQPAPPAHRTHPNQDWSHFFARDILSVPDKWEFPWFAVWDTAFHMVPHGDLDPPFAKDQLLRFLRDWYQHPNGQIPAYEFNFSDVNPPVHAWACRRVYERDGRRDKEFLKRAFHKLALNFTWWVNRKDRTGKHLFTGGFLGLDNIGVFDRSHPLPTGGHLEQADGTAWMAFFCAQMLAIALELALSDPAYEDMASKFLEHYVAITHSINTLDGTGLWDEADSFYYDHLHIDGRMIPLKVRSMVGLIPLLAVELISREALEQLPDFRRRLGWLVRHRRDVLGHLELPDIDTPLNRSYYLLSLPSFQRLEQLLRYVFDESEFLSPFGIRSLSRVHADQPYIFRVGDVDYTVAYVPGEADNGMFGGNSNWRGPVWLPLNFLLVESLQKYGNYYGDNFKIEIPTGSGNWRTLKEAAEELTGRLVSLFMPRSDGHRPCHGEVRRYADDPHWRDLILFYEYFHGDTGRGCGASHQTGWSALVATLLRDHRTRNSEGF